MLTLRRRVRRIPGCSGPGRTIPLFARVSFSTAPIPWEQHQQWFARKSMIKSCHLFIAMCADGTPVGQIRFETTGEEQVVVSVSIDRAKRGSGHGRALIELGVQEYFKVGNATQIHAFIKSTTWVLERPLRRRDSSTSGQSRSRIRRPCITCGAALLVESRIVDDNS